MRAAQCLDLLRELLDVVDEDAEMVQAGIVETLADLVGLEPQDRQINRPVAQVIAIGERPVGLADLLEVERLLVELGHRIGVLGGNGDVTQLGHTQLLFLRQHPPPPSLKGLVGEGRVNYSAASLISAGSGSAPAQACSAMSNRTRSGP